jgi:hypothetical protein
MLVETEADNGHEVGDTNHHESCLSTDDPVLVEDCLGCVVAKEEEERVDVVHDKHQGRRDESERDRLHAGNVGREDRAKQSDHEAEELELDDPPLVLELELGTLRVGDDVRRRLEDVVVDLHGCLSVCLAEAIEQSEVVRLLLQQRGASAHDGVRNEGEQLGSHQPHVDHLVDSGSRSRATNWDIGAAVDCFCTSKTSQECPCHEVGGCTSKLDRGNIHECEQGGESILVTEMES